MDPNTGSGRAFFITIPEIYTEAAIAPAVVWLGRAKESCGGEVEACAKVEKASVYIDYLRVLRGAVNATNAARGASKEDVRAGLWTQTVDAVGMVSHGQALTVMARQLKEAMVVNILCRLRGTYVPFRHLNLP